MRHYRPRRSDDGAITIPGVNALQSVAPAKAARAFQSDTSASPAQLGWLVFWMSGTLAAFIVAAISVRALAKTLGAFEIMSIRSAGGLVILVALAMARPELLKGFSFRRLPLQMVRNAIHVASQVAWTTAIIVLPFATVFALEFTIPAWVALLAVLFLGERMTVNRAAALIVCFVGVLVILRPGLESFQPAALLVLGAALAFAITAIITKKLITTETTFAIMFWMNLMQLPLNLAGSDWSAFLRLDASMTLPLIGIAGAGLAVHYCLTNAFRCGDATIVIPMDFLRVPLIAVIGWMFYSEHLDVFVFAGAALIIAGVLWNVRSEAQRNSELAKLAPVETRGVIQPAE